MIKRVRGANTPIPSWESLCNIRGKQSDALCNWLIVMCDKAEEEKFKPVWNSAELPVSKGKSRMYERLGVHLPTVKSSARQRQFSWRRLDNEDVASRYKTELYKSRWRSFPLRQRVATGQQVKGDALSSYKRPLVSDRLFNAVHVHSWEISIHWGLLLVEIN